MAGMLYWVGAVTAAVVFALVWLGMLERMVRRLEKRVDRWQGEQLAHNWDLVKWMGLVDEQIDKHGRWKADPPDVGQRGASCGKACRTEMAAPLADQEKQPWCTTHHRWWTPERGLTSAGSSGS